MDAVADCRTAAGPRRSILATPDPGRQLGATDGQPAIVVVEHDPPVLDAVKVVRALQALPGREHLHVLVADPTTALPPFAAVDSGADDYVADALHGPEFAFRLRASDGALEQAGANPGVDGAATSDAEPLAAAELAPGGEPTAVLAAAAREGARVTGGDVCFIYRFADDVVVAEASWGVERLPRGMVFQTLEDGILARVRREAAPQVANLRPRPLGREQSVISYIRKVYRSGLAVPLRLGTVVWGSMLVGRVTSEPFSQDEVSRLERFADRAAVTLGISERRSRIQRLAESDLQTGLLRREVLLEHFREIQDSGRGSVGMAIFQILDLGELRGAHGRAASEYVLSEVGGRLGQIKRAGDFQARWDEGEIVWLLDDADLAVTREAAGDAYALLRGGSMGVVGEIRLAVGSASARPMSCGDLVDRARRAVVAPEAGY